MADWCQLPGDLVIKLAQLLDDMEDFIAFRSACSSWRYFVHKTLWKSSGVPHVCFINKDYSNQTLKTCSFSNNMYTYRTTTLSTPLWGSQCGWIFGEFYVENPLTQTRINLPQLEFGKIQKALVLKDHNNDIVVMVIYGRLHKVALVMPGFKSWITNENERGNFEDIISCGDEGVFGIRKNMTIVLFDINHARTHRFLKSSIFASSEKAPPQINVSDGVYLVELMGDLVVILTHVYNTSVVGFFKVDRDTRSWTQIDDLGDNALFVGDNNSTICGLIRKGYNQHYDRNSIYFLRNNHIIHAEKTVYANHWVNSAKNVIDDEKHHPISRWCCSNFFWLVPSFV